MEELTESFNKLSKPTKVRFLMTILTCKKGPPPIEINGPVAEENKEKVPNLEKPKSSLKRKNDDTYKLQVAMKAIQTGNNSAVAEKKELMNQQFANGKFLSKIILQSLNGLKFQ